MSRNKGLVWYCVPCKEHKPRNPGERKVRCENCNKRMKKRKLAKDGTVVTIRMGLVPDKERGLEPLALEGKTAKDRYEIFSRSYTEISPAQKRGYLKRLWKNLFPKEEYPAKQTNWMVHLRLQYELASKRNTEENRISSPRFNQNYEATRRFKVEELTAGLGQLSTVYNQIEFEEEENV